MQAIITVPCYLKIGKKNYLNLNTYRNAHYRSNNMAKQRFKALVLTDVKQLPIFTGKVFLEYRYYLKDRRRCDIGNIHSIVEKYFLDAMVETGRIEDDNYRFVVGTSYHYMKIDAQNPRCEITIKEIE